MGMFDYVIIDKNMLPISDKEKEAIGENPGWQTKDMENVMTEVYITNDGELKFNNWELEAVPKKERPYPNAEGFKGQIGSLRRVNEKLVKIEEDITINFYSRIGNIWYDFFAEFKKGKLIRIEVLRRID